MSDPHALALPDLWAAAVAIVLPLIIAVLTRASWPSWLKSLAMVSAVFVTTAVGELIAGTLGDGASWRQWLSNLLVIFLLTVTTYRHVWKPTGAASAIEDATTPAPRRALPESE